MKVPLLPLRHWVPCKPQPTKMGNFDKDFVDPLWSFMEFLYINGIFKVYAAARLWAITDLKEQQPYELPHPKMREVLCQGVYKLWMIIQPIQHHSKCLNTWTFRAHFRISWWMAYKTFQMGCRTSLTSNGIAVVCVLETPSILLRRIDALCTPHSTSFNQGG